MTHSRRSFVCSTLATLASACGPRTSDQPRDPLFDDPSFARLGPPAPGSWRTHVKEPGQTFEAYRDTAPNKPTASRNTLVLQPLGPYPSRVLMPDDLPSVLVEEHGAMVFVFSPPPEQLAVFASIFFGVPSRVAPERPFDELGLAPRRVHRHHDQFDARMLLSALAPSLPDDAYSLMALVTRDLVVEDRQDFAFGFGLYRERLAAVSFARLDPQYAGQDRSPQFQTRMRERSHKLLAHELGHTLGFGHCDAYACVMNGIANLDELDVTPLHLCPVCLRKLLWLVEIEPLQRYRELAAYYETHGLDTELAWLRGRIARLEAR